MAFNRACRSRNKPTTGNPEPMRFVISRQPILRFPERISRQSFWFDSGRYKEGTSPKAPTATRHRSHWPLYGVCADSTAQIDYTKPNGPLQGAARRRSAGMLRDERPNTLLKLMRELRNKTKALLLLTATPMQVDPIDRKSTRLNSSHL